jgi:hypothetical protein
MKLSVFQRLYFEHHSAEVRQPNYIFVAVTAWNNSFLYKKGIMLKSLSYKINFARFYFFIIGFFILSQHVEELNPVCPIYSVYSGLIQFFCSRP